MKLGPIYIHRSRQPPPAPVAVGDRAVWDAERQFLDAHALFTGYGGPDIELLHKIADHDTPPQPGFIVDFVGSKTRTDATWTPVRRFDGQKLPVPINASDNFHGETVEWVGLAKAILSAKKTFTMVELGAGLGVWSIAGGVAARRLGLKVLTYGVEGDELLANLMSQHYRDNGFEPEGHAIRAAIGSENGIARWPKPVTTAATATYNFRPVLDGQSDYMGRDFAFEEVPVLALRDLLAKHERWDLIHMDIQGHETEVSCATIKDLNERVNWMVVGTHSRKIDGDMIELLWGNGWVLENEKPAKFQFDGKAASLEAMTLIDGTQVWRNPRLD
ncbi:FkbM family methyltransferase [Phyllobacterium sp. 1468]|uniref:FkbM family methyltransferase n=1 Tax=Phyllobacterium sp. 1468 TaxID=2817759 RepID=UPI00285B5C77|nr:FkbM family methyltransferase [Phyllobacterium sp. 1468]MDR6632322.1 FkbM family methyltransferase [Phyllobacterium sp. 1468]